MLGVKLTIVVTILAIIWYIVMRNYLENNPHEAFSIGLSQDYPWWLEAGAWLIAISLIGIIYSVLYLLFAR